METVPESDEQTSRPATARLDVSHNSSTNFGDDESSSVSHQPEVATSKDVQNANQDQPDDAGTDLTKNLPYCSWEELQERFIKAMDERTRVENSLQKETAELLEIFTSWSQTTTVRDEERAFKRLKARLSYVEDSESKLEDKKKRYADVIRAFENALALLQTD